MLPKLRSWPRLSRVRQASLKSYKLTASSQGVACTSRTAGGHVVVTDLPRAMGGRDAHAQPVELMLAALLGCKTATAHFVARHLWKRPYNRIETIQWHDVLAVRDDRGATSLPIGETPVIGAGILRVSGVASIKPRSPEVSQDDVTRLGELVEQRCPLAVTLAASGCEIEFKWVLAARGP